MDKPTPQLLKQAILDLQEPIVFKNIINNEREGNIYDCLSFEKLKYVLGEMSLTFRTGKNLKTKVNVFLNPL